MGNIQNIEVGLPGKYFQISGIPSATEVPGIPAGSGASVRVILQAVSQNIRYRIDGVDPTTTVGVRLHATESHSLNVAPGTIIKVIEEAASAELNVMVFVG